MWTHHVPDHNAARGSVDEDGNVFMCATELRQNDTIAFSWFHLIKLDPSGIVLWERKWYAHKNFLANYECYTQGLAVSPFAQNRQVIVTGTVQTKDTAEHNGDKSCYMKGFNAETGDSLWQMKFSYRQNEIIGQFWNALFDSKGHLWVLGNSYSSFDPVSICFLSKYFIPGVTLDVKELPFGIPETFSLSQNYPNPFNPKTNIRFDIPSAMDVSIKVYNTLGQEIAILVNQRMNPGVYEADWDASDVPSGVYFYRLQTETFVETKKMLLVK